MSKSEEPTIDIKLFIDKEKCRVLFAESNKEFVDVLFSFLTLPLGTIVRLLGKQSQIGCLDEVYKNVEDLSADYFRTKACKTMLLRPLNAAAKQCCQLKIKVDDTNPRAVYVCKDTCCCAAADSAFSSVPDAICRCGKVMQYIGERPENGGNLAAAGGGPEDGVFVKGCLKFIITDDLEVAPASTSLMLSLFEKFGVQDPVTLEQRILQLSSEKITSLLKRSLTSKQPLTGLYFDVAVALDDSVLDVLPKNLHPEQERESKQKLNDVMIRVLQTKDNSSLLYAEVGDDFVNILFGFLSVPLGSIIKTYGSSNGCVDNLYRSIDGSANGCMKPECQSLLLSPKLAPFFGCGTTNVLQVEELDPEKLTVYACFKCFKMGGFSSLDRCRNGYYDSNNVYRSQYMSCQSKVKITNLCEWDPKSPKGGDKGEAYLKRGPQKFMVTDDLHAVPLSLASTLQVVSEAKVQTKEIVEKEFTLTTLQVMELQRAALVSHNALSSVLLPPKKKKKLHHLNYGIY